LVTRGLLLFASALFAVVLTVPASAQITQPISQLPGPFLNGAGFFASGGTNYGAFSPCRIGTLFITGLGPTSPPLVTGARPHRGVDCVSTAAYVAMALGDSFHNVAVLSARASPEFIGVDELDFQVPADAPTGNDVFIEVGVLVTNPGVGSKLPIQ
jgi:uncharacterized protein (TIGR03437 family)